LSIIFDEDVDVLLQSTGDVVSIGSDGGQPGVIAVWTFLIDRIAVLRLVFIKTISNI
jgi:hypothetical protein